MTLGIILVAAVYVGLYIFAVLKSGDGWLKTLGVFALSAGAAAVIVVGALLIKRG